MKSAYKGIKHWCCLQCLHKWFAERARKCQKCGSTHLTSAP